MPGLRTAPDESGFKSLQGALFVARRFIAGRGRPASYLSAWHPFLVGIVRRQGVYHPPVPEGSEGGFGKMEEFIRKVQNAGPYMLVFTTVPGMAKAVGVALKATAWPEIRGVLAEEDTLFVVTNNVYDSRLLMQRLKRIVQT